MDTPTSSDAQDSRLTSKLTPLEDLGVNSAIVTINQSGIIQSVDKSCCELFGYTLSELVGENVAILIPKPYKEQHHSYIERYNSTGKKNIIGASRIVEAMRKDSTIFRIRLHVAEIPLAGSEKVFIGTIERLDDAAAVITASLSGTIISSNKNCTSIFGYSPQELSGKNLSMLMPSPHKENHDGYIKSYLDTGVEKVINKVRNVPAQHKDGTIFPVCLRVERIQVGVVDLLKGVVEKVDYDIEAVFTLTSEGLIHSCNQFFVQTMFGYHSEELIGNHINILIPEFTEEISDPAQLKQKDPAKVAGGELTTSEGALEALWRVNRPNKPCVVVHKDGSTFLSRFAVYKFIKDGVPLFSARLKRLISDDSGSEISASMSEEGSATTMNSFDSKRVGEYVVMSTIGKGSYGRVLLARHEKTGAKAAIKVLQKDLMDDAEVVRSLREVQILKRLDHPHIAELYDVVETPDRIHIIMEYTEGGELLSYVKRHEHLGEDEARRLFLQLVDAVAYCHNRNIIHRDIKHKNILMDRNNNVKLIDFGLSNFTHDGGLRETFCGTPAYAAPEMILAQKYTGPEVDVWSMGVVLFSMVEGTFPFPNVSRIVSGKYKLRLPISEELKDLISGMLTTDPRARISLKEVLSHEWCKRGVAASEDKSKSPASDGAGGTSASKASSSTDRKRSSAESITSDDAPHEARKKRAKPTSNETT